MLPVLVPVMKRHACGGGSAEGMQGLMSDHRDGNLFEKHKDPFQPLGCARNGHGMCH